MTGEVAIATALLGEAVLFVGGVVVLGVGAWVWSRAIGQAHQARYNAVQATILQQGSDVVDHLQEDAEERRARIAYVPPTEDELREAVLAERAAERVRARVEASAAREQQPEFTTQGNEGIEEQPPIPEGGLYHR